MLELESDIDIETRQQLDQKLIKASYRRLLRSMIKVSVSKADKAEIRKAFVFAMEAHGDQRRKSGEPYITHPLEVARICFQKNFGDKISRIVDGLTKLDGLYNVESPQAENFKKVLSTLVDDVRVILIKMADRLHNLRTIDSMPRHKQIKIAAETFA